MQKQKISAQLLTLRELLGLNQSQMGAELGVSRNFVSMIESGKAKPSLSVTMRIEELLKRNASNDAHSLTIRETAAPFYAGTGGSSPRERLRAARIAKGLSVRDLARKVGYSIGVYQAIEDGTSRMGEGMARKVAKVLDIPVEDLLAGSDEPPARDGPLGTFGAVPNVGLGPGMENAKPKFVPLLSMAECGTLQAYVDEAYTGQGWLVFDSKDPKAFAVQLAGDSMAPKYGPGDVALVYPSFPARNGNVVIARLNEDNGSDVMCKVFQASQDRVTLVSYNPIYQPLQFPRSAFQWIYPVAQVTTRLLNH